MREIEKESKLSFFGSVWMGGGEIRGEGGGGVGSRSFIQNPFKTLSVLEFRKSFRQKRIGEPTTSNKLQPQKKSTLPGIRK